MVDLVKIRRKARENKLPPSALASEHAIEAVAAVAESGAAVQAPVLDLPAPRLAALELAETPAPRSADSRSAAVLTVVSTAVAAVEAADPDAPREYLSFKLGREEYAIPIERIIEIIPYRKPTRVPNSAPDLLGILSLRGTIVTLLDLRLKLAHNRGELTDVSRIIVVDGGRETVGMLVDDVYRVVRIRPRQVEPPPSIIAGEEIEFLLGVVEQKGRLLILLDIDKLLKY